MDTSIVHEASLSVDGADGDQEAETDKGPSHEGFTGEMIGHLRRDGELLTEVELDVACSSEKLRNLNVLMMNVATRESEFESLALDLEDLTDSSEKALEFDLLFKILYSEARELQNFMAGLQTKTVKACELISACKHSVESFSSMEEKLIESEDLLKQLQEQVLDIRRQSATFRRTFTCFDGEENGNGNESRQVEEELKQKLFCMEEEISVVSEKLFEADNVAEVLMGISKELLGRLHILQFNLNSSLKREDELRSKFDLAEKHLTSQERTLKMLESGETRPNDFHVPQADSLKASLRETEKNLNIVGSEAFTLREKVSSLENQLKDSEFQLQDSEIQLQHAVASAEASLEKQNMLYSTIGDMGNLIEDLKLKVSKADSRADSAEDKCIILSESNADLNEELNFLRGRMGHLELALHQSEGIKLATAKDIGIRTKVITNLVMQLAIERERLQKQISSLVKENKTLIAKLQKTNKNSSAYMRQDNQEHGRESLFVEHDRKTCTREGEGEVTGVLTASFETEENISELETEMIPPNSTSEIDTVRRIDAGVLNIKHVFIAIIVLLISAAVYLFQQPTSPF